MIKSRSTKQSPYLSVFLAFISLFFFRTAFAQDSTSSPIPAIENSSLSSISDTTITQEQKDSLSNTADFFPLSDSVKSLGFLEASKKAQKKTEKKELNSLDPELIHARNAAILGIIPGGGQIYNKRWWKLPIVYGVLGGAGWFVVNSAVQLKKFNTALDQRLENIPDQYAGLLTTQQVVANRNFHRRNVQLGAVGFTVLWGLSIVDAVVDAHMKTYDISDDLSIKFKPKVLTVANKSVPSLSITLLL